MSPVVWLSSAEERTHVILHSAQLYISSIVNQLSECISPADMTAVSHPSAKWLAVEHYSISKVKGVCVLIADAVSSAPLSHVALFVGYIIH